MVSYPGTDNTVDAARLGQRPDPCRLRVPLQAGSSGRGARAASAGGSPLTPSQWVQLIAQIGEIPEPEVSGKPSAAAIPEPERRHSARRWAGGRRSPPTARAVGERWPRPRPAADGRPRSAAAAGRSSGAAGPRLSATTECGPLAGSWRAGAGGGDRRLLRVLRGGRGHLQRFELENASQIVLGDQVQVGGVPVGSVTGITLTHKYKALITIHVEGSLMPLHQGTTAQIRVPSLTTVAGRYVALTPGPNNAPALPPGATLPPGSAQGTTRPRPAVRHLHPAHAQGPAGALPGHLRTVCGRTQLAGSPRNTSAPLAAADHIFAELDTRPADVHQLPRATAKAVTTIASTAQKCECDRQRRSGLPGARCQPGEPRAGGS